MGSMYGKLNSADTGKRWEYKLFLIFQKYRKIMKNFIFSIILGELCILGAVIIYYNFNVEKIVAISDIEGGVSVYRVEESQISKMATNIILSMNPYVLIVFFVTILCLIYNLIATIQRKQYLAHAQSRQVSSIFTKKACFNKISYEGRNCSQSWLALPKMLFLLCLLYFVGVFLDYPLSVDNQHISIFFVMQFPVVGTFAIIESIIRTFCMGDK